MPPEDTSPQAKPTLKPRSASSKKSGITCELEHLGTQIIELSDGRCHHCVFFIGEHDGPYDIQRDELDGVRAFTPEELRAMIDESTLFHPDCRIGLVEYVLR